MGFGNFSNQSHAKDSDYSDQFFISALLAHIPDTIYFKDREGRFLLVNEPQVELLGAASPSDVIGKTDHDFFLETEAEEMFADEQRVIETGTPMLGKEERITGKDGSVRWFSVTKVPLYDDDGKIIGTFGLSRDISERKALEFEREKLISKLQDALDKVHTLHGLVPICANCKKIKDDQGYWHEVDQYIQEHSDAEFSHGLCKACVKELYPGYVSEEDTD